MRDVVIVSAARTPFGKLGGTLKSLKATDLGGLAIKEALSRAGIQGGQVDEVVYGMVAIACREMRQRRFLYGLPENYRWVCLFPHFF